MTTEKPRELDWVGGWVGGGGGYNTDRKFRS